MVCIYTVYVYKFYFLTYLHTAKNCSQAFTKSEYLEHINLN